MTVSSSTNRVSYAGNGSTTVFPYTYKIFDEDDLTVIVRAANGTETVKTITSDYTVSGVGSAGGGNVTMLTAPASGETLVILREQDLVQELDIVPNDPFPAESLEAALDKLTFMVQQHQETLGRSLKVSRTTTISSPEFTETPAERANKFLAFDASGDLFIAEATDGVPVSTFMGTFLQSTDAAAAFTYLGVNATASELNILDGVTASTAELNILDGVTASTAELNILDGVTASTAELNILDGVTATTAELNQLDGNSFTADLVPSADSTYDIGTTSARWAQGWFDDVTSTNTSDGTLSIPTTYVTNGSAKAWVNFDGTGTIAARDSLNLSSLTDNGVGDYTVNFTSAMGNTTYALSGAIGDNGLFICYRSYGSFPPTTSAVRIACTAHTGALFDIVANTPVIHGDLA